MSATTITTSVRHTPATPRVVKETLHLLLDLAVAVAGGTLVVTGLALGAGLAVTLIGIPVLALTLVTARAAARAELARARALLGRHAEPPAAAPAPAGLVAHVLAPLRDTAAWRAVAYFALMLPVGVATFTAAVAWIGASLTLLTLPVWGWALPHGGPALTEGYIWHHPWQLAATSIIGLGMTLATGKVVHAITAIDRRMLGLLSA